MPFVDDPRFNKFNDSDIIWRYIDFAKFVSMLESKSLYFTRSDKLLKQDPYEGFFHQLAFLEEYKIHNFIYPDLKETAKNEHPKYLFINCWHINENESDAMWKIYGKNNGIAIKSTIKKLKDSLNETQQEIKGNKITYRNHRTEKIEANDSFERFSMKGISFRHEEEFRLFHFDHNGKIKEGNLISISLQNLVDKVLVSPVSPDWFLILVKSIWKKYGYSENRIEKSPLYENPS